MKSGGLFLRRLGGQHILHQPHNIGVEGTDVLVGVGIKLASLIEPLLGDQLVAIDLHDLEQPRRLAAREHLAAPVLEEAKALLSLATVTHQRVERLWVGEAVGVLGKHLGKTGGNILVLQHDRGAREPLKQARDDHVLHETGRNRPARCVAGALADECDHLIRGLPLAVSSQRGSQEVEALHGRDDCEVGKAHNGENEGIRQRLVATLAAIERRKKQRRRRSFNVAVTRKVGAHRHKRLDGLGGASDRRKIEEGVTSEGGVLKEAVLGDDHESFGDAATLDEVARTVAVILEGGDGVGIDGALATGGSSEKK